MIVEFDWPSFIEVPGFTNRWMAIGCTDRDLRQLQLELLSDPTAWPIVPGARGWRKARFAPESRNVGKSGALRVYYALLFEFGMIVLGTAFAKSEMSDLPLKAKRTIARILTEIKSTFEEDS